MSRYHRILLILSDVNQPTPALHKARALATASGAELRIHLHVDHRSIDALSYVNKTVANMAQATRLFHYRDWLEEIVFDLRECGFSASGDVHWENHDAKSILMSTLDWRPDLIIKDVAKSTGLRTLFPISIDHDLLRLCPFPLYLVHREEKGLPLSVAAAVDPSHAWHRHGALNERVIRAGLQYSSVANARFTLLSVFDHYTDSAITSNDKYESKRHTHKSQITTLGQHFGVAPEQIYVHYGDAAQRIARLVHESGVQLLVIGSLCRLGLLHLFSASVAAKLLDEVNCDLLAIKPAGYANEFTSMFGTSSPQPQQY